MFGSIGWRECIGGEWKWFQGVQDHFSGKHWLNHMSFGSRLELDFFCLPLMNPDDESWYHWNGLLIMSRGWVWDSVRRDFIHISNHNHAILWLLCILPLIPLSLFNIYLFSILCLVCNKLVVLVGFCFYEWLMLHCSNDTIVYW